MTSPKLSHRLTAKLMNFERNLAGFERKVAALDGLDMVYYENKTPRDKPTLVLIHGYTADKTLWHRFAKLLAKDYHIIAPDMAGHGETLYDPNANYSIPAQTALAGQIIGAYRGRQSPYCGQFYGRVYRRRFRHFASANYAKRHLARPCRHYLARAKRHCPRL